MNSILFGLKCCEKNDCSVCPYDMYDNCKNVLIREAGNLIFSFKDLIPENDKDMRQTRVEGL